MVAAQRGVQPLLSLIFMFAPALTNNSAKLLFAQKTAHCSGVPPTWSLALLSMFAPLPKSSWTISALSTTMAKCNGEAPAQVSPTGMNESLRFVFALICSFTSTMLSWTIASKIFILGVGTGVAVGTRVAVGTGAAAGTGVAVGAGAVAGTGVAVGTGAAAGTGVAVGPGIAVGTDVAVGTGVAVGTSVDVGTGAESGTGVAVADVTGMAGGGGGSGEPQAPNTMINTARRTGYTQ